MKKGLSILLLSSIITVFGQKIDSSEAIEKVPPKTHTVLLRKSTLYTKIQVFGLKEFKKYQIKSYQLSDYLIDPNNLCVGFVGEQRKPIPYHIKQEHFTLLKKK